MTPKQAKGNVGSYLLMTALLMITFTLLKEVIKIHFPDTRQPVEFDERFKPKSPAEMLKIDDRVIISNDNFTQIQVPDSWQKKNYATSSSNLQISVKDKNHALEVTLDPELKLPGITFTQYAEQMQNETTSKLQEAQVERTTVTEVQGKPAIQYRIQGIRQNQAGSDNGKKVVLLLTLVETSSSRYMLIASSPAQLFGQKQQELQKIIQSFREIIPM